LIGLAGNDTYVVDNAGDVVTEAAAQGTDLVQSSITYTLTAEVENLALTGTSAINATGNGVANALTGNTASNVLDGGAGADTLRGGAGNDTYIVDSASDVVTENASEGTDLVQSSVTLALAANVENLTLVGASAINATGNTLANVLVGNAAANVLNGGAGNDTMRGGAGDDTYVVDVATDVVTENASEGTDLVQSALTWTLGANLEKLTLTGTAALDGAGNALANVITGNAGNNVLNGAAGADTLVGGAGNDSYIVDNTGDVVTEGASAGTDAVSASVTYTLAANVENLTLTGTAAINGTGNAAANVLTGNAASNVLDGASGADTLVGGTGNDTYFVDNAGDVVTENTAAGTDLVNAAVTHTLAANVENLTLTGTAALNGTGNALNNVVTGNAGNNVLNGGAGTDTLIGGAGNDTYVVDVATDVTTEAAGGGIDTVQSGIGWTLGAEVENLTLTGTAAVNGTGNALANVLTGNAGDNTLNGAAGADTMSGGSGNDSYFVDNTGDVVTETAGAGTDAVNSAITFVTSANVEFLTLAGVAAIDGTGNAIDNWLAGNTAVNTLAGMDGNDALWGDLGDDVVDGNNGNDLLQGGGGNDRITDLAGNNLLDGGAGADTITGGSARSMIIGGAGADTITTGGGADVIGFNKGDGADVVNASTGTDDTLSLGGGLAYADLKLKKSGLDLVLDAGNGDQITFKNWYQTGVNNKSVLNLQVVAEVMAAYNPAGTDPLLNKKVVQFNFTGVVNAFDAALAANPTITSWSVANALAGNYVAGSDVAAIGGDFAYDFGHRKSLADIGATPAQGVLASASFGTTAQALQAASTLYSGTVRLH
jgi:Ca2+-binding RTX toxin-like protein